MEKHILARDSIEHRTRSYPIYLLSDDLYVNDDIENDDFKKTSTTKCFCSDCNKLFDIPKLDFKVRNSSRKCDMRVENESEKSVKATLEDISCPECGNKSFYSVLCKIHDPVKEKGKINMHGAWVVPFSLRDHTLYDITDDNGRVTSINDSVDLAQTIIYPSGKKYERHVDLTETFDIENRRIYVTKSQVMPSGESKIIYKSDSGDVLQSVDNVKMEYYSDHKRRINNRFRCLSGTSFIAPNDAIEGDIVGGFASKAVKKSQDGYMDYKDFVPEYKFALQYKIKGIDTTEMSDDDACDVTKNMDRHFYRSTAYMFTTDVFNAFANYRSDLYAKKRRAIESAFKGQFDISPINEDVYLSSERNRLYLSQHTPNASEENTRVSETKISTYNTFMVKYPAAFEYACQKTDEDLNNRVIKTLKSKDIEITEDNINNLLRDLPDSAKGKMYRENMFNIANQVYMSDKNVTKAVHDAKNPEEMIAFMRYYAFGPEKLNDNIGEIKIPEHLKNKTYMSNELIQNDEELRAAFDKNPIGFANISYTAAKILRTSDKNKHYELTKALYAKTQSDEILDKKNEKYVCNVSRETVLAVNHPATASMMTKYAKLHGINAITELYNNDSHNYDISTFYVCEGLQRKLKSINAEFVETPDPELLKNAVTIDELKSIIILKDYLSSKSDGRTLEKTGNQVTDQAVLKQACIDFVDRFGEKTPEIISRFASDINSHVYVTWNDGKALFEHSIVGIEDREEIKGISGLNNIMNEYVHARRREERMRRDLDPDTILKFESADGVVIDDMRFDMIRSYQDLAKYNNLVGPKLYDRCNREISFGITDTKTDESLCVFAYDMDNHTLGIHTRLDPIRNNADPSEIADAINTFTKNLNIKGFESCKIDTVPVIDETDERLFEQKRRGISPSGRTRSFEDWDPVTGRNLYDKSAEADADKRRELAAKIYGVDDNDNIKIPDIKIEMPGD